MKSRLAAKLRKEFDALPDDVQVLARQAYRKWLQDPWHNSLQFKRVHPRLGVYSVRIGAHYRAVGARADDEVVWFWIGTHAEYDALLKQL